MTTWWWVRHGPTHEKTFVGHRDVPADLSDTAAIARLSAWLPDRAALVSSDLGRAVSTADALSTPGRTRLTHDPALREFDFGAWDGLGFDDVAARDPDLSRAFWETPGDIAPPDGESWNAVALRVTRAVDALTADDHRDIIAVAHIGTIMTQIQRAGGLEAIQAISHRIDNLSVTRTRWDGESWSIGPINHIP